MANKKQFGLAVVKPNWDYCGLIDTEGNYVLDPVCRSISRWSEGLALIEKVPSRRVSSKDFKNLYNGEYGFIDFQGNMITDFSYGYAESFFNGWAAVNKNKKWGFIDKRGNETLPFDYDSVGIFVNDTCIVSQNKKWGIIDRKGKWILDNVFDHLSPFGFGMAEAVVKNGSRTNKFIIDINGNKILDLPSKWNWFLPVSEKIILFGKIDDYPGEAIYGFMDIKGNILCKPQFYTDSDTLFYTNNFVDGKLPVYKKNGERGYITEEGEYVISNELIRHSQNIEAKIEIKKRPFKEVLNFSEGLAVARQDKLWGVIDENNNVVVDFKYQKRYCRSVEDSGLFFSEDTPKYSCGLIGVCEERDTIYSGYLDTNGEIAIDMKFRIANPFCTIEEMCVDYSGTTKNEI